ncbi:MAG TPA: hypothetical protein VI603_19435 [Saprospiraceae bacterium]|nr:hypothetical protein [Saprospiraceae bacterium]
MKNLVLIAITLCLTASIHAQIYLQLEKAGTLKTIRYSEGDVLIFRLKNDDKGWYERIILSLDVKRNRLIFPDVVIPIDSIEAIRLERKAVAAQIIGTALQAGGINLMLFTGYDAIFHDRDVDWTSMGSGFLNIAIGTVLKRIFRHAVFRISTRKRLRLLDLNFEEPIRT